MAERLVCRLYHLGTIIIQSGFLDHFSHRKMITGNRGIRCSRYYSLIRVPSDTEIPAEIPHLNLPCANPPRIQK
jgi:hypothetical protein